MNISSGGVAAFAVTLCFTLLAFFTVVARIFTRAALVKTVGAEDYIIIAAMAASIIYLALVIIQVNAGIGEQAAAENSSKLAEAVWGTSPVYFLSLGLSKISIVVQCLRIFHTSATRRALHIFLGFSIFLMIWSILSAIFNCYPPQAAWGAAKAKGKCLSAENVGFANAALNIFSDICTLVIPIPSFRALQIPQKQKIILIGVFSCGGFACITSVIRLYSFWAISTASYQMKAVKSVDIAIWSGIEINIGIVCASVPTLKPLAVRMMPRFLSSDHQSSDRLYGKSRSTRANVTGYFSRHSQVDRSQKAPIDTTIMVKRSIELSTMATNFVDDADKISQDGSQNDLVEGKNWYPGKIESGNVTGTRWGIEP